MGGMLDTSGYKADLLQQLKALDGSKIEKELPAEIRARIQLMPKPGTYADLVTNLKDS
jgi:hypothetical protein